MIAYNPEELKKLEIMDEAHSWYKSGVIDDDQWSIVAQEFSSNLYHPPIWLRVLLFIATIIGVNAGMGLFASTFLFNTDSDNAVRVLLALAGISYLLILEFGLIKSKQHYKSGVSEAFLFLGLGQLIITFYWDDDISLFLVFILLIVGVFIALRYLNLIGVIIAAGAFAYLIFDTLYSLGGFAQAIIPMVFVTLFGILYMISQYAQKSFKIPFYYKNHFILIDIILLILTYLGGNYLVVRELSIGMMGLDLAPGEDIPFAFVFYFLTSVIPLIYLLIGLRKKNIILIRTGVLILFASVITFKYYYSSGHTEFTLTLAGSVVLGLAIWALNYLKTMKHGYTREQLLSDKWSNLNAESILVSSTMGGNASIEEPMNDVDLGGGEFGGGGAGDQY